MPWITETGRFDEGWTEVVRSLERLLTTRLRTRVYRRDIGSELLYLVDAPMNLRNMMRIHHAVAKVIEPEFVQGRWMGEPRFRLTRLELVSGNERGEIGVRLFGSYLPKGHLGDDTVANDNATTSTIMIAA